ncbi:TIGR03085 family metal-binding protein [Corynebacterium sp. A21]|uniref:TIGR03085 family metal-binding protein n=1 Tax=Corynebacterium sp. A21 TaxID=3457318 RepID=UPI003FD06623
MSFSSFERARLAELMLELGPDAPTLCEGWTTRDMAIHLFLREHAPVAAAGIFLAPARGLLAKAEKQQRQRPYAEIVREWAAGPRGFSPWRLIDDSANFMEHFIHHEDVRRGGGVVAPRDFSADVNDALYRRLKLVAPRMLAKSTTPVILVPVGKAQVVIADSRGVSAEGGRVLRVAGPVGELLLWASGRDVVQVEMSGDPGALGRSRV